MFLKMCKIFSCLTFVENGCPRDYGLVFTLQFAFLTSCLCYLLSQWSSRDGSSSDMVFVRLWRQSDESLDRSLMFLHLMFLVSWLFTGLSKDSIRQTQQFPSLKRRMEVVDQWQDAFSIRVKTQGLQESWIVLSRFSCLFINIVLSFMLLLMLCNFNSENVYVWKT